MEAPEALVSGMLGDGPKKLSVLFLRLWFLLQLLSYFFFLIYEVWSLLKSFMETIISQRYKKRIYSFYSSLYLYFLG